MRHYEYSSARSSGVRFSLRYKKNPMAIITPTIAMAPDHPCSGSGCSATVGGLAEAGDLASEDSVVVLERGTTAGMRRTTQPTGRTRQRLSQRMPLKDTPQTPFAAERRQKLQRVPEPENTHLGLGEMLAPPPPPLQAQAPPLRASRVSPTPKTQSRSATLGR